MGELRGAQALRTKGWSISAIAHYLGHDRKTIRAYLNGERRPGERANPPAPERYRSSSVTAGPASRPGGERLADPMLAASLLDWLLHRGIVVAIEGPSYRMRAHQQRTKQLRHAIQANTT